MQANGQATAAAAASAMEAAFAQSQRHATIAGSAHMPSFLPLFAPPGGFSGAEGVGAEKQRVAGQGRAGAGGTEGGGGMTSRCQAALQAKSAGAESAQAKSARAARDSRGSGSVPPFMGDWLGGMVGSYKYVLIRRGTGEDRMISWA